ncbi:hypothetical protein KC328_g105 [Hortaea werneckii]|nr:hypothetical protein KC328_g105 [Hortaea werneckii]
MPSRVVTVSFQSFKEVVRRIVVRVISLLLGSERSVSDVVRRLALTICNYHSSNGLPARKCRITLAYPSLPGLPSALSLFSRVFSSSVLHDYSTLPCDAIWTWRILPVSASGINRVWTHLCGLNEAWFPAFLCCSSVPGYRRATRLMSRAERRALPASPSLPPIKIPETSACTFPVTICRTSGRTLPRFVDAESNLSPAMNWMAFGKYLLANLMSLTLGIVSCHAAGQVTYVVLTLCASLHLHLCLVSLLQEQMLASALLHCSLLTEFVGHRPHEDVKVFAALGKDINVTETRLPWTMFRACRFLLDCP